MKRRSKSAPPLRFAVVGLGHIAQELVAHGASPDLPVALVRWGTTGQQRSITGSLADIDYFEVID